MTKEELAGKKPEELVQIILDQKAEIKVITKVNSDMIDKIEEISKKTTPADAKAGVSKETFVVGKKKYGFKKLRINHKDEVITADEVLDSEDLQKELVRIGSGMIVFIENEA